MILEALAITARDLAVGPFFAFTGLCVYFFFDYRRICKRDGRRAR